jgi:hypothetical protein
MTKTGETERAEFETTRRLLACLINEGLVDTILKQLESPKQSVLCLQISGSDCSKLPTSRLVVGLNSNALVEKGGKVICPIAPEQLELPVRLESSKGDASMETNPSRILQAIHHWIPDSIPNVPLLESTKEMLQSCADNQGETIHFDTHPMYTQFSYRDLASISQSAKSL